MPVVTLTPSSETSSVTLPATGTLSKAQTASNYPFGIYGDSSAELYDANFVSGYFSIIVSYFNTEVSPLSVVKASKK